MEIEVGGLLGPKMCTVDLVKLTLSIALLKFFYIQTLRIQKS